jgi:DNA polymerase elongation subunit (family B)
LTGILDIHTARNGLDLITWLCGGEMIEWTPPIKPYFLVADPKPYDGIEVKYLSDFQKNPVGQIPIREVWKQWAKNIYDLRRFNEQMFAMEFFNNFVVQLCIRLGFDQNVNWKNLNVLALDGEMSSKGQFPNPLRPEDRIKNYGIYSRSRQEIIDDRDEKDLILHLKNAILDENPDILLHFSGTGIDFEYPMIRAKRYGIDFGVGRDKYRANPYISRWTRKTKFIERTETSVYLSGRICMDVYKESLGDTSLTGMRHSLKVIGRHFFGNIVDVVEVDYNQIRNMSREELGEYVISDARLTYLLGEHYLKRIIIPTANDMKIPLSMAVRRTASLHGNLFYGRNYRKQGILADGNNLERFQMLLGQLDEKKKVQTQLGG